MRRMEMREGHIEVRRTARYYTIGEPAAQEVWFVCHGYAQLARFFLRSFAPLDDGSRLIVAPEALNRYYFETSPGVHAADARVAATWMTREDRTHEIADSIAYLDALHGELTRDVSRGMVVAFGFSQGAATVSRWAARGRARIDHVVLWAGAIAHDLELAPHVFRGASLTLALGDRDAAIGADARGEQETRMRAAGLDYHLHEYEGGHRIDAAALENLVRSLPGLSNSHSAPKPNASSGRKSP